MADWLSQLRLGRPVIDRTGLTGGYYIKLQWARQQPATSNAVTASTAPLVPSGPSIFEALEQQLGLKLKASKDLVQIIVIDHIERPSAN